MRASGAWLYLCASWHCFAFRVYFRDDWRNSMYNCYHCNTMVNNNIIVYLADHKVINFGLIFPGGWHDGSICINIPPIIHERLVLSKNCFNQGFSWCGNQCDVLVNPVSKRSVQLCYLYWEITFIVCHIFIFHCIRQVNGECLVFRGLFQSSKKTAQWQEKGKEFLWINHSSS